MPSSRMMKDTGLGWLGEVPDAWQIKPFFTVGKELNNKNKGMKESNLLSLSYGNIVLKDIDSNEGLLPESFEGYQIVEPNDLVFRFTDLQNDQRSLRSAISGTTGIITSAYLAVRPTDSNPQYLAYLMRAYDQLKVFYSMGGGLRQAMNFQDVRRLLIPVPPFEEQSAIADFLDRETAQIDALIGKQQQLIETLAERRKAVIARAVTKGLDPTVRMKHSGIEWLGEIPAHWVTSNVKRAYRLTLGKMLNAGDLTGGIEMAYLRAGNIQEAGVDISEVKTMTFTPAEAATLTLLAGDVVVVEGGGGYGRSDFLKDDLVGWGFQNHVIRARPAAGHLGKFFDYYVKFLRAIGHFEKLSSFATIPNVSAEKLGSIEFPIVSQVEQVDIVSYLDAETSAMEALTLKATSVIELLQERRQALISAAVTGKIDVRGK